MNFMSRLYPLLKLHGFIANIFEHDLRVDSTLEIIADIQCHQSTS